MPRYRYVGAYPRVFVGLTHGLEAVVERPLEPGAGPVVFPEGSTVELEPGDILTTIDEMAHPELELAAVPKPRRTTTAPARPQDPPADPQPSAAPEPGPANGTQA